MVAVVVMVGSSRRSTSVSVRAMAFMVAVRETVRRP
jgi:hypothetical protein